MKLEECAKLRKDLDDLRREFTECSQNYKEKCAEYEITERDYRRYQDQNRQFMIDSEDMKKSLEEVKIELKMCEEKLGKKEKDFVYNRDAWLREK
jgi:chromosome segregation ATPase